MSDPTPAVTTVASVTSANPVAQSPTGKLAASGDTHVSSVSDLKTLSPEVYKAITVGIAMSICHSQNRFNDHIKEINRKTRERDEEK